MLKHKFKYFWFVLILIGFTGLFLYLRMDAPMKEKSHIYSHWTKNFVVTSGDTAYINTTKGEKQKVVLSEGQGYGMLIAVKAAKNGLADKEDFDKLYRYYLANRLEGSSLMSWRQTVTNGVSVKTDNNNATDGDLYIAYALLEASKVWKSSAEDYRNQAKAILSDILSYNYNPNTQTLTVGNWANQESNYYNLFRTSDAMPEQFEAFAKLTGNATWITLRDSTLNKLSLASQQHSSGLISDFIWIESDTVRAAQAKDIASENDGDYYYNACRVPYHLAQSKDDRARAILKKMMTFFNSQKKIVAGYRLDGKPLHNYQSASFLAPIFYAANQKTTYRKLVQQSKFIFVKDLSDEAYYEMALTTMIALDEL